MYWFVRRLFEPLTLSLLIWAVVLVICWRRCRGNRRFLILPSLAWIVIYLIFSPVVADFATQQLEAGLGTGMPVPDSCQVIVVLGGSLRTTPEGSKALGADSIIRCMHAVKVYQETVLPVIVSGGDVEPTEPGPTLATVMAEFLETVGIPKSEITREDTSTTTYENARETVAILKSRGISKIALVTHAGHVRRARRCFEAFDVEVHPVPCNLSSAEPFSAHDLIPSPYSGAQFSSVVHELLGMVWYHINGRVQGGLP